MRILLAALTSCLLGCATIVSKNAYPVRVDSNPTGASLLIRDARGSEIYKGDAPTTVTLRTKGGYFRPQSYEIEASLEGYGTGHSSIHGRLDGWYFGNIAIGGLVGMVIVDPLTGAMWRFDPSHVVNLQSSRPSPSTAPRAPDSNSSLPFDRCFERCRALTDRNREQCFDVCADR